MHWLHQIYKCICTHFVSRLCSFSKVLEQKEQLEQKHLHLLQIMDSERQAKWHYVQQTEELAEEVKKLKEEVRLWQQNYDLGYHIFEL